MEHLDEKIHELEARQGELGAGQIGRAARRRKTAFKACHPVLALVADNRDPECLGRIRVSQDMLAPGSVSGWLPIVGHWKKRGSGWWALPEIGVQALVVYTQEDRSEGYVLGFIHDELHRAPEGRYEKHPATDKKTQDRDNRRRRQGRDPHRKQGWQDEVPDKQGRWHPAGE